jgi:uncharacterized membrane protein
VSIDAAALLTIAGMALVTLAMRLSGLRLIGRLRLGQRGEAALEAVPAAVLTAVIAPAVLTGGPADLIAAALAALAALRLPLLATVAVGVGAVVALRALLG